MEILPFRAPALSPLEAHVFNLLCTRAQPWPIDVAGTPCALEAGGLAAPVPPVCAFDVGCGQRTWRVELGSLRLLALHPAVADVPPNAALPEALQLAVLDLLAAPLAELAQTFLHVPLAVRNVRMIEAAEPAVCALPLTLHVPVGAGASAEAYPIPVRLCLPDRESALELVERLDALPRRRALGLAGDVPVPVSLEAGRMRLSVNELSSLEPDDVLLPETYPAREGRVTLRLCATLRSLAFACSLAEGCATILSVLNPEEGPMSDENNTAAGAAPSEGVDTGELEVTLTFELERRLMTVRDVETLAPGYTFAFGGDALAPQLDAFVDAVVNGSMPATPHSHKGMALVENVRWVAENAYGVSADRVILKDGFAESLNKAVDLCASAGIDFGSLALVAVKSPATMTDNDSAPAEERTVTLKKVEVHSGAGLVHVNLTVSLTTPMPKIV